MASKTITTNDGDAEVDGIGNHQDRKPCHLRGQMVLSFWYLVIDVIKTNHFMNFF